MNLNSMRELHDALLTYMKYTGANLTKENIEMFDISDEEITSCRKFYEQYVRKS